MDDMLLDSEFETSNRPSTFSRFGFWTSVLTTTICITIMSSFFLQIKQLFGISIALLVRAFMLSVVFGFVFSIISLVKKEKLKYLKAIGVVINFLFFAFLLAAMFATLMDFYKSS